MKSSIPSFELVIPRSTLERVTTELQLGHGQFAKIELTTNRLFDRIQFLANRAPAMISSSDEISEQSSLRDYLLIETAIDGQVSDPLEVIAASRLRAGQLLCLLQTGIGGDPAAWRGVIVQNGKYYPVQCLRLVGPGMLTIQRNSDHANEDDFTLRDDVDPWSRFRGAIGDKSLEKVHDSSVLLFGAGKIGSLMALNLVMMGVKKLTIVDFDTLEPHNLFATFGATAADVGQAKSETLARHLAELRPECTIHACNSPSTIRRS